MTNDAPHVVPAGWEGILEPGEDILWQGRPDGTLDWSTFDLRRALFGTLVMAFAVFWTTAAMSSAPPGLPRLILPLPGLFFFGLGLRHAGGHMVWNAYRRRHSWYTLTDRRAIIATDLFGRKAMTSKEITFETPLTFAPGDPGSIWFAKAYSQTKQRSRTRHVGFERLPEAREVYDLMRGIQRESVNDDG